MAGKGDLTSRSAPSRRRHLPHGYRALEKRNIALEIPVWDADLCTQCGKCALVCPHAAIRAKAFPAALLAEAPRIPSSPRPTRQGLSRRPYPMSYPGGAGGLHRLRLCVDICPIRDKSNASHKALNMASNHRCWRAGARQLGFLPGCPSIPAQGQDQTRSRARMLLEPLFEFSGACVGCGETPYLKLASQLFGDRMVIANATGCSSIYGGNLPTTPWTTNATGARPGLEQLAVRGQRRVWPGHTPGHRQAARSGKATWWRELAGHRISPWSVRYSKRPRATRPRYSNSASGCRALRDSLADSR
jgi:pyruvate-ferredoxin/flavodoxin oxidoreductase